MHWQANWITPSVDYDKGSAILFEKTFTLRGKLQKATLYISSLGIYEARLSGARVGAFIFAPGWTEYIKRIQYQTYDVTALLTKKTLFEIELGTGWMRGRIARIQPGQKSVPPAVIAELHIDYADGTSEVIVTDEAWHVRRSPILFSDIYDGEVCDARFRDRKAQAVKLFPYSRRVLIATEGEEIREQERLSGRLIKTPRGETVLDFGQNMTGYIEFRVMAKEGEEVRFDCAEVLDADGNFYRDNYRSAKSTLSYICREGLNVYKPKFTFFGFRYIRLLKHPGRKIDPSDYTAIVVHSAMERTGYLDSSNKLLNRLFDNIIWGQKSNYLDVPTDCPQRDERMGWTGDAQVFARAASFNFDVEKFFRKWLHDLSATSGKNGAVPKMVPYYWQGGHPDMTNNILSAGAAWGDAATVCPWEMYLTYGDKTILREQWASMHGYVDYMTHVTHDRYQFTGHHQYGDWLGLDAPEGSYKGSSREDLIAQAFYAHSTDLVIRAGRILGKDVAPYEALYRGIGRSFRKMWQEDYRTQTECALALHFHLTNAPKETAARLVAMVHDNGDRLTTGFVGTPYLLHALSENGYADVAYSLLLQENFPSWLFSVRMGATTMWEHWDGQGADGSFWSEKMNSFNHYAYGAVADWVYTVALGIRRTQDAPGFQRVDIAPTPDPRLSHLGCRLKTRQGLLSSRWVYEEDFIRYEITVPCPANIVIDGKTHEVDAGSYLFYGKKG